MKHFLFFLIMLFSMMFTVEVAGQKVDPANYHELAYYVGKNVADLKSAMSAVVIQNESEYGFDFKLFIDNRSTVIGGVVSTDDTVRSIIMVYETTNPSLLEDELSIWPSIILDLRRNHKYGYIAIHTYDEAEQVFITVYDMEQKDGGAIRNEDFTSKLKES